MLTTFLTTSGSFLNTVHFQARSRVLLWLALLVTLGASVLSPAPALAAPTDPPVYERQWGGLNEEQFSRPWDMARDSAGNIYVVDTDNNRIQKYSSTGVFITMWGGFGGGNGYFDIPQGIAVDNENNVYVVDSGNSIIQKFSSTGTFLAKWGGSGTASRAGPLTVCNL